MKPTTFFALGLMALTMAFTAAPTEAEAQNRTNILVMAEDGDPDALERDNQIVKRIQRVAIEEQLNQAGYDVYDETALTLNTSEQGRKNRKLEELLDIARNGVRNPGNPMFPVTIRTAVTYEVFASVKELAYGKEARVRISGRMIDVPSGRYQGSFEVTSDPGQIRLSPDCSDRTCLTDTIGDYAKELGQALGAELATLLDYDTATPAPGSTDGAMGGSVGQTTNMNDAPAQECSQENQYFLKLVNFDGDALTAFENLLVEEFSCYKGHELNRSTGNTHYITYRSGLTTSKMARNLRRALNDELGWPGSVTSNGHNFSVTRSAIRPEQKQDAGDAGETYKW